MNILSKKVQGKLLQFKSANDKITVIIDESNNGPVFILDDGSQIQFTNMIQYYNIIIDPDIFNVDRQTFNMTAFKDKYFVTSDDVDRFDISEVEQFTINNKDAYRYILAS